MASDLNDLRINQENLQKLTGIVTDIDYTIINTDYKNDKRDNKRAEFEFIYSVSKEIVLPSLFRGAKARERLYQAKLKQIQWDYGFRFLYCIHFIFAVLIPLILPIILIAVYLDESDMDLIGIIVMISATAIFVLPGSLTLWPDPGKPIINRPYFLCYIGSFFITGTKKRMSKQWAYSLQPTPLGALIDEVINYNKVIERFIKNVKVIDQLKAVGNPVEVKDRDPVIKAFRNIKSDLERAIKTEKILRENPDFKPEEFSIDLTFLRAVRFEEKAQTYAEFVNDAIEIGLRVQEEMKNLQSWS